MDNQYNYNTPMISFKIRQRGMEDRIFISDRQTRIFLTEKKKRNREIIKKQRKLQEGSVLQLHLA